MGRMRVGFTPHTVDNAFVNGEHVQTNPVALLTDRSKELLVKERVGGEGSSCELPDGSMDTLSIVRLNIGDLE
jgi:aspartate oxidase